LWDKCEPWIIFGLQVKLRKFAIPALKPLDDLPPGPHTAEEVLAAEEAHQLQKTIIKPPVTTVQTKLSDKLKYIVAQEITSSSSAAVASSSNKKDSKNVKNEINESLSAKEEETPISDAPLKLLNAVDPAVLDKAAAEAQKLDVSRLPIYYLGLSKSRLTGLVVVTAMAGYAMAPATFALIPFASLTLGTALTSASANTINQIIEIPYDSQMDRTKNRVLVRNHLR
jgi:hypothetical protein